MAWDLRSKREIEGLLQAAYTAISVTVSKSPYSADRAAYLEGCETTLQIVAQGLDVECPVPSGVIIEAIEVEPQPMRYATQECEWMSSH